jgi:cytochrome bd-type quinol oxidase subunit 1
MVDIPKKKKEIAQNYGIKLPYKGSVSARDDSPLSPKPAQVHLIKPIEICSQCGDPLIDKNRIYCMNCGAYIREIPYWDISSMVNQEPASFKETTPPVNPKAHERRMMIILAVIIIIFVIFMLMLLLSLQIEVMKGIIKDLMGH